jgi:anti-anti-sigma factor
MQLTLLSEEPEVVRMECAGRISQAYFDAGSDPIEGLLGPGGFARKALLSLEKTEYIDSSGISWLIGTHKRFLNAGGRLVLHSIPPLIANVLQMLRLPLLLFIAADGVAARALAFGDKK